MNKSQLNGFRRLIEDSIEHGSAAVETIQLRLAGRSFGILERIPIIAPPSKAIHLAHDVIISGVHRVIRSTNRLANKGLALALEDKPQQP